MIAALRPGPAAPAPGCVRASLSCALRPVRARPTSARAADEEDYFSREDDEEGDAPGAGRPPLSNGAAADAEGALRDAPPRLLPLVDYDDDDDGDDAGGALRAGGAKRGLGAAGGLAAKRTRLGDERPRGLPVGGAGGLKAGLWRGRR
jgi:hypothetical protein